jgi:hypothetical protein
MAIFARLIVIVSSAVLLNEGLQARKLCRPGDAGAEGQPLAYMDIERQMLGADATPE